METSAATDWWINKQTRDHHISSKSLQAEPYLESEPCLVVAVPENLPVADGLPVDLLRVDLHGSRADQHHTPVRVTAGGGVEGLEQHHYILVGETVALGQQFLTYFVNCKKF